MSEWVGVTRHRGEAATFPQLRHSTKKRPVMNETTKRVITRWIHLVFSIPIIGYLYSPFRELPNYAPVVRYVAFPMIALTGLWMWKGAQLRRLFSKRPA